MSQGPCSFPRPAQPWGSGHLGSHTPQAPQPSVPTHQRTSCQRFSPGARRPAMPCPAGRPLPARRGAHGGGGSDCSRSVPSARSLSWRAAGGLAGPGGAAGVPSVRRPAPPSPWSRILCRSHRDRSLVPHRFLPWKSSAEEPSVLGALGQESGSSSSTVRET